MNTKSILKNIFNVLFSNLLTVFSGVIAGFVIPKILSVYGYGMYKTFTLYVSYIGFCGFGIIDGILLKYGNKDYEELDFKLMRTLFKWFIIFNAFFSVIMLIIAFFITDVDYSFLLIMMSINIFAVNITGYYQQISQITQRFKEYSYRKIIQSLANILLILLMFFIYFKCGEINYRFYVIAIVLVNFILSIWYLNTYKELTFGEKIEMKNTVNLIFSLIKIGLPLLFANLLSTLILTLDRQYVNILFDTETYAIYAFAYNMLALVTVAMSAISTVLYPLLKRTDEKTRENNYSKLNTVILIIVFMMIAIYFPLSLFINWFLPKYNESLEIFLVIFPGLALSSSITIVMHNYYKILNENNLYFLKSIVVLIVSAIANLFAYILFKTTISISIASIFIMFFWYLYVEQYFVKKYKYDWKKNFIYIIVMTIGFYIISKTCNSIIGFISYVIYFLVVTYIMFKKNILGFIKKVDFKNTKKYFFDIKKDDNDTV